MTTAAKTQVPFFDLKQQNMPGKWLQQIAHYGTAIGVVVLCTVLRMALDPVVKNQAPFTVYFAGVMFVAWFSRGWGPSLMAITLGSLTGSYLFCEPRGSIWIDDSEHQITLGLFIIVGIYLVYLSNLLARDIARRKLAETELRQSQERLRHHQEEVAHAARLSSLGEVAAGLAHELNQPLCAVSNYADGCLRLLRNQNACDSELTGALRQIAGETNRAAEIVRRVRKFAQKRQSVASPVSIVEVVEESVSISQSEIGRLKVAVNVDVSRDLPPVAADQIQIEQVLTNLLRNALEAMVDARHEDRRLTIRALRAEANSVEVVVSDRGNGIGADQLANIFEPFFTTKPEGMGLGLAICRSIIQAHGGRIWADSQAGRGTSMHFTLPAMGEE